MLQTDPHALRYAASCFAIGANELRGIAIRSIGHKSELVTTNWRGTASESFDRKSENQASYLRKNADVLEKVVPVLHQLANQMDHIMELRRRADQYEQASWEYSGDTMDDLHHRQNLARQAASLRQQADWEANQADAVATGKFHELMTMIPGFGDLLNQVHELYPNTLADIKHLDDIHQQLLAGIRQYYKSKQREDLSDAERSEAAEQYLLGMEQMSNQDLYNLLEQLLADDERAQYYQKLTQDPNFDAKAQMGSDPEYKRYVLEQGMQSESPGSTAITGLQFAVMMMKILQPKFQADHGPSSTGGDNGAEDGYEETGRTGIGKTGVGKTGNGIPIEEVNPKVLEKIYPDDTGAYGYCYSRCQMTKS